MYGYQRVKMKLAIVSCGALYVFGSRETDRSLTAALCRLLKPITSSKDRTGDDTRSSRYELRATLNSNSIADHSEPEERLKYDLSTNRLSTKIAPCFLAEKTSCEACDAMHRYMNEPVGLSQRDFTSPHVTPFVILYLSVVKWRLKTLLRSDPLGNVKIGFLIIPSLLPFSPSGLRNRLYPPLGMNLDAARVARAS